MNTPQNVLSSVKSLSAYTRETFEALGITENVKKQC